MTGSDLVKHSGALRDGLLVSSSIVYLLGYVTWSIYAWRSHLGPVSALDAQYFAAGLPIALGSLCTLGSVFALRHVADVRWRSLVEKRSDQWRRRVGRILGLSLSVLVVVTVALLFVFDPKNRKPPAIILVVCALMILAYTLIALLGAMSRKPDLFTRVAPSIVLTIFGFMGIVYFALDLYPSIPASLGGGRPRLVVLDIQTSSVAPETLRMLLPPDASIPTSTAVRTRELKLFSAPGQYYLIGIPSLGAGSPAVRLQLERSAVVDIIWTK